MGLKSIHASKRNPWWLDPICACIIMLSNGQTFLSLSLVSSFIKNQLRCMQDIISDLVLVQINLKSCVHDLDHWEDNWSAGPLPHCLPTRTNTTGSKSAVPPNAQQSQPRQVEQFGNVNYVDHYIESAQNHADIVFSGFVLLTENNRDLAWLIGESLLLAGCITAQQSKNGRICEPREMRACFHDVHTQHWVKC